MKYRKALLNPAAVASITKTLKQIELRYDSKIEQAGDDQNHIHLLVSFHPKYSSGEVVRKLKSLTARELCKELPQLRKDLWGGEFWSDGYDASTVGTGGNWTVVERSVKNQGHNLHDLQRSIW